MTPELRNAIVMSRVGDYNNIMRTTMLVFAAVAAILHFGAEGYSAPLTMVVLTITAYGILARGRTTARYPLGPTDSALRQAPAAVSIAEVYRVCAPNLRRLAANKLP